MTVARPTQGAEQVGREGAGMGGARGWAWVVAIAAVSGVGSGCGGKDAGPKEDRRAALPARSRTLSDAALREEGPRSLKTVPVPEPAALRSFVRDRTAAVALGKAFFWDTQAGSDGTVACATCHFHAGADGRALNQVNPGPDASFLRPPMSQLRHGDFPFHRVADATDARSRVLFDVDDVVGSQGVRKEQFTALTPWQPFDLGALLADPLFNVGGHDTRQVTGRNTPTVINAAFNYRNFWDGRANNLFNGASPFGPRDPNARIWADDGNGLFPLTVLLENAALASQAVGPPGSPVEMSFAGRTFPQIGRKLLARQPLAQQQVHPQDSVLGALASRSGRGLCVTYLQLIERAFAPRYWQSAGATPDGFSIVEANFSLFWGLAIQLYEETLVSNDAPYDRFAEGDDHALTSQQKLGLDVFTIRAGCTNCHQGPEFTSATVGSLHDTDHQNQVIERMAMGRVIGVYDHGFYNIGVRPTGSDLGVGGRDPFGNPLSFARQLVAGKLVDPVQIDPCEFDIDMGQCQPLAPTERVVVDGSFKVPSLRNVELTGPYMHNGGMATLDQVVRFYNRGGDFPDANADDLAANMQPIRVGEDGPLRMLTEEELQALVAFLRSLTDERVRRQMAPFDHPELATPNGPHLPAVGASGGPALQPFEHTLGR